MEDAAPKRILFAWYLDLLLIRAVTERRLPLCQKAQRLHA